MAPMLQSVTSSGSIKSELRYACHKKKNNPSKSPVREAPTMFPLTVSRANGLFDQHCLLT
jgi:hypothetical protein